MTSVGLDSVESLFREQLGDPGAGWSVGTFGAIAEFMREPGEPYESDGECSVSTARGGLRFEPDARIRAVAYERAPGNGDRWSHGIALCLPESAAAMHRRRVVTELGPDTGSLRPEHRDHVLFDLGLDTWQVDVCVRTDDPETLRLLREAEGQSLFRHGVAARMPELSPHRVFRTRFGRAEVGTPIPPPDGTSPDGPHTHLLPRLLASGRTHAATEPVPAGWVPCAHVFPAHPLAEPSGESIPFDRGRHERFQELLDRFGDADAVAAKRQVVAAVHAGQRPDSDSHDPKVVRLVLRQLTQLGDTPAETITAWAREYDVTLGSDAGDERHPLTHPDDH